MNLLKQHIEALIFCSEASISIDEIQSALEISMGWQVSEEEIRAAIGEIKDKYKGEEFSFELNEIAEGFQFLTKKEFHDVINALIKHKAKKKLSVAQMETLSIIAYKQPISKSEIEHIRGVNCDYAIQKLLEKDLIEMQGKSDGPGKPMMYGTSQTFMDYFGIRNQNDLPQLKDLHAEQNEIGIPNEIADGPVINAVTDEISHSADSEEIDETAFAESSLGEGDMQGDSDIPDRKTIFMEENPETRVESKTENS